LLSAAAVEAGLEPLGAPTAERSPFGKYLAGWGRPGDAGVVARAVGGAPIGAAWYRLFPSAHPGYGFVAPDVPELSIRLLAGYRGQGVGSALLAALRQLATEQGYRALSLSVDRGNPARRLYARHGFRDAGVSTLAESSITLVATLAEDIGTSAT
jgi:GNAT superfamily N-acetyltransferase